MEPNTQNTTISEIQKAIREKSELKRKQALRKMMKYVMIFVLGFVLAAVAFFYDRSSYSKVNSLWIRGNYYLSDEEVIELSQFELGTRFYTFLESSVESNFPKDSLIDHVEVSKQWFDQALLIQVYEKPIVGYRLTDKIELIASDGVTKGLLNTQFSRLKGLPRISGFDQEEDLKKLADGLGRMDKALFSNISEIIKSPQSYDELYLKVLLADGIELNTSIYSLEQLPSGTYQEIVNHLPVNQKCIVYDVFWNSSYSKQCPVKADVLPPQE